MSISITGPYVEGLFRRATPMGKVKLREECMERGGERAWVMDSLWRGSISPHLLVSERLVLTDGLLVHVPYAPAVEERLRRELIALYEKGDLPLLSPQESEVFLVLVSDGWGGGAAKLLDLCQRLATN